MNSHFFRLSLETEGSHLSREVREAISFHLVLFRSKSAGRKLKEADRQTDRQTDRQIDRQTDRQTDVQTDRQTDRKTDRQTNT